MRNKKVIAFYLPQYHCIPENDKAYGIGFTEWTNVKKANPLFENHNQPRIPLNNNYYSLLDEDTMIKQATLAKKYGIYGFCYYHYWFKNGKKLLEQPLEKMLNNKDIDIPYMLCWANENWTKKWDGGNNEIIVEQDYDDYEDLKNHIDYLCEFFSDERYIKIDGKPIFVIYKPDLIPNLDIYLNTIRNRIIDRGFPDIVFAVQYPDYIFSLESDSLFDLHIQFEPKFIQDYEVEKQKTFRRRLKHFLIAHNLKSSYQTLLKIYQRMKPKKLIHRDYISDWDEIINYPVDDKKMAAGAFVDWDNTSRNVNGLVYDNVSVKRFKKYFKLLCDKVDKEYSTEYIFINAWNEWAEGAYLEPDTINRYGFLEAIKEGLDL